MIRCAAVMAVFLALLLTGCGSGTTPTVEGARGSSEIPTAPPVQSGGVQVTLQFAPSASVRKLPAATRSWRWWVLDPVDGQQDVAAQTVERGEGDSQTIVIADVPAGAHNLLIQALDAQGSALAYALQPFTVTQSFVSLTVEAAVDLRTVDVAPSPAEVALGTTLPLSAVATFSDGSSLNVTGAVEWSTAAQAIATVSAGGLATGVAFGTTTATASLGATTGTTNVIVEPRGLQSLTVSPSTASIALGLTQSFAATGHFDDGSTQNLTSSVIWSSSKPEVAVVDAGGLATSAAPGVTSVTATLGGTAADATLTVEPHALVSLTVTPESSSLRAMLDTQQFSAMATYTDGVTEDATAAAVWLVDDPSLATISSSGHLRVLGHRGSTSVRATLGAASDSSALTLRGNVLVNDYSPGTFAQFDDFSGENFVRGLQGDRIGNLGYPYSVGVDAQGRIYIPDLAHARIVRIDDISGTNYVAFGTPGPGVGQFFDPTCVRVDSQGRIYVVDCGNHRVVRMDDMQGSNFTSFGSYGSGVGELYYPWSVALDTADRIYVTDSGNNRVVRVDDMSASNWTELGGFANSGELIVDASGRVLVADYSANRVVAMDDMAGTNFTTSQGNPLDPFSIPDGISLDAQGRIYVADTGNNRIVRMDDMNGTNWTQYGSGLAYPNGVTIAPSGRILIADSDHHRVVQMDDMAGTNLVGYGSRSPLDLNAGSCALDSQGRLLVADSGGNRLVRVDDREGTNFASMSSALGLDLSSPWGVAVDALDRIYVADVGNGRILRMDDIDGTGLVSFGTSGNGVNQFNFPAGIFVDAGFRIYVADVYANRVVRFDDMTGTNWTEIGTGGGGAGQFSFPVKAVADAQGRVYVADQMNYRIVRMDDMSGAGWTTFAVPGNGYVTGLTFGTDGSVYWGQQSEIPSFRGVYRIDDMSGGGLQVVSGSLNTPNDLIVR